MASRSEPGGGCSAIRMHALDVTPMVTNTRSFSSAGQRSGRAQPGMALASGALHRGRTRRHLPSLALRRTTRRHWSRTQSGDRGGPRTYRGALRRQRSSASPTPPSSISPLWSDPRYAASSGFSPRFRASPHCARSGPSAITAGCWPSSANATESRMIWWIPPPPAARRTPPRRDTVSAAIVGHRERSHSRRRCVTRDT